MKLFAVSPQVVLREGKYTKTVQLPSFLCPGNNAEEVTDKFARGIELLAGDRFVSCDTTAVEWREINW